MESRREENRIHPAWWTAALLICIVLTVVLCAALFTRSFTSSVPVTLTSDRAGLVMDPGNKVKLNGVQVGRVTTIGAQNDSVSLHLDIDPSQVKYIPANVEARIKASTAFGSKYVDLIEPNDPSPQRISAGAVIRSENVSTEVNTVFQDLVNVIHQIDPAKLNAVLGAIAEGLRGQGGRIGEATTDANQVLLALNARNETSREDWKAFKGFSDTYASAAQNILSVLDAASTTSTTITRNASALDALLLNATGFAHSGIGVLGPNKDNLVTAINVAEPTTRLLMKYNPELTCLLVGGRNAVDLSGYEEAGGGDGKSLLVDAALLLGDDPYKYPDNLPIVGAKGGPGGQPGCGSLPDVAKNYPQRQLITNTGWGTGLDLRPNPGIGFPGYADYFPSTRGVPAPPSIRNPGGAAPGPVPYPGAPPYGAAQYAPDGTPLYPGLPPAPPPGAPREDPVVPGQEPFVVPVPGQMQPTPTANPPLADQGTPPS
ncbi:MCE family protein [Mycolicibacterium sp. CH28]|uniref:MCE family protein n=1 Tax=Mycolicibacterium sp. CH28 TaxID=2512237 RepID=UPI001080A3E8|nr:MCE family protein [Mycolicibacterium sp. CH28]TGD85938.1 MCE family protein [Mycolicibacterium sp. CH28]